MFFTVLILSNQNIIHRLHILNSNPIKINALSADLIARIKSIANKGITFAKGDLLFKEGDHNQFVYLIEKGEVALFKDNHENKVEIFCQNEGDIVGIDLIFIDKDCEYSAMVQKPSILYKVLISDFKDLLAKNNGSSIELLRYLSSLLNKIERKKIQYS